MFGFNDIPELIKKHEGCKFEVYLDTKGVPTGGVGHAFLVGSELSLRVVNNLFDDDFRRVWGEYDTLNFETLKGDSVRQAVVFSMLFNLGLTKFLRFKKTIAAIRRSNWWEASVEMLDSKWAKDVGYRAVVLADMMRTGEPPK